MIQRNLTFILQQPIYILLELYIILLLLITFIFDYLPLDLQYAIGSWHIIVLFVPVYNSLLHSFTIFLFYKQDQHSMRKRCRANESIGKVFVNEFLQYFLFEFKQEVDGFYWRIGIFFQFNLEIIKTVESKCFCSELVKNISILMVFLWNRR